MTTDQLLLILGAFVQPELDGIAHESAQSRGSTYLRERLTIVAERMARDQAGDLLEIGCLNGSTTVRLAQVARLHGRRVIAVDPWEPGTQNCTGAEYGQFLTAIAPYADIVDVVRKDSRDPDAIAYIKARPLCFAFVDGLHEYQACLSDIWACHHAHLIVVDDITWNEGVRRAWNEGTSTRQRVELPPLHEGYIL
jgi:predicted O-methyltransferase YrrM